MVVKPLLSRPCRCLRHQEPVLLVGETGTGKTSVCQLLALMRATHLHVLNCNQHTETSDFLGGFRPTRTRDRWAGVQQQCCVVPQCMRMRNLFCCGSGNTARCW
eukprot:GHRQ01035822.1.p3 GENE.GHRQ01035822.1~~GHRQ01035822.1.p3  ORF type:complete len:104 (-),score=25.99 GHRQ01035822.1:24-335(-)